MALKVLIVDDSALMRKHISGLIRERGHTALIARNGREAVTMVLEDEPDVVTLDVNMPEMDGLSALAEIIERRPTPVVMVSSLTEKGAMVTLEAMALGAVDYIAKPGGTISLSIDDIAEQLLHKIEAAASARIRPATAKTFVKPVPNPVSRPATRTPPMAARPAMTMSRPLNSAVETGLVVIGVSTGGPRTLEEILPQLPENFPWAIAVAQHMPASFTAALARRMNDLCQMPVQEAGAVTELVPGTITIAKGGTDIAVAKRAGKPVLISRPESAAHVWHPSVELLVETAQETLEPQRLIAVQLTGMGNDGAVAMHKFFKKGGRTIAESEESAVIFGMPKELIALGGATQVLPARRIAQQLMAWAR